MNNIGIPLVIIAVGVIYATVDYLISRRKEDKNEGKYNLKRKPLKTINKGVKGKQKMDDDTKVGLQIFGIVVACILVAITLIGGIVITPAGYCNVVLTFGDATGARDAGLSLKAPLIQSVEKMSVRTQLFQVENATSASKDLQDATTSIAINYRIDSNMARKIYKEIGTNYIEVIAHPAIQEIVKATTARYDAADLILKREIVKEEIARSLTNKLQERGIKVEAVNITNFTFSQQFTAAIESKVVALQAVMEAQNKLERVKVEAQQAEAQAKGEAAASVARAKGQAEAASIISAAMKDNPEYLRYMYIDKLASTAQVIIVPEGLPMTIPYR